MSLTDDKGHAHASDTMSEAPAAEGRNMDKGSRVQMSAGFRTPSTWNSKDLGSSRNSRAIQELTVVSGPNCEDDGRGVDEENGPLVRVVPSGRHWCPPLRAQRR